MIVSASLAVVAVAAQASASFAVPPGSTLSGLERLSEQARIDVVVTADLSGRVSPAVRGSLPVEEALRRLLTPVGARDRSDDHDFGPLRRFGRHGRRGRKRG